VIETYKVGDFGYFMDKKGSSCESSKRQLYMSPQERLAYEETQYDPFKADVFALGAISLELATLSPPNSLRDIEHLEEVVNREIAALLLSPHMKTLLKTMLAASEAIRPSMKEVLASILSEETSKPEVRVTEKSQAVRLSANLLPQQMQSLAYIEQNRVKVWSCSQHLWQCSPLSIPITVDMCSQWLWVGDGLFCSGGIV
jgi:serine/threonine protein kinase